MKRQNFLIAIFCVSLAFVGSSAEARDLTYKIGFGYEQISTNGFVDDSGLERDSEQLHGLGVSYGVAEDMMVDFRFAFGRNFDRVIVGPSFRYDFQRLFSRHPNAWQHLNIYVKAAFFVKAGDKVKTGVSVHAPYLGFEVFPFESNHFAISSQAGLVIDFVEKTSFGFTQGLLGDLGVRFYF